MVVQDRTGVRDHSEPVGLPAPPLYDVQGSLTPKRTLWRVTRWEQYTGPSSSKEPKKSFWKALVTYQGQDRARVNEDRILLGADFANSYGSRTTEPWYSSQAQMPLIDLDYPHRYRLSSSSAHGHLELNVPISYPRWVVLMVGLYFGKVIEPGYFWWSLRRGTNTLRLPGVTKNLEH